MEQFVAEAVNESLVTVLASVIRLATADRKMQRRVFVQKYNERSRGSDCKDITLRDLAVIEALGSRGALSPSEIASEIDFGNPHFQAGATHSSRNGISQVITRLMQSHGLLTKYLNLSGDQRKIKITLTEEGEKIANQLAAIDKWISVRIVHELSLGNEIQGHMVPYLNQALKDYIHHQTDMASAAGVYDYILGGSYWSAKDAAGAEAVVAGWPNYRLAVQENRAFLRRATWYLASYKKVRQFLDIGAGYPSTGNTHEIALKANPDAAVAYVDDNVHVIEMSKFILKENSAPSSVSAVQGDLKQIDAILDNRDISHILDLSQPVAVLLVAVVHFVEDDQMVHDILQKLYDRLAPRSYLVLSHATQEGTAAKKVKKAINTFNQKVSTAKQVTPRTASQLHRLLGKWRPVEYSELRYIPEWRSDIILQYPETPLDWKSADESMILGGVFQKVPK